MYARDIARIATPVGVIAVYGNEEAIEAVQIDAEGALSVGQSGAVRRTIEQLQQWFDGERAVFDVPLAPAATVRGQALRDAMIAVGYGETLSYGALADIAASSARAIGQACARNPFPIIVPCHRITNANGSLGAYSAGAGPRTKRWLLDFEQRGRSDRLL